MKLQCGTKVNYTPKNNSRYKATQGTYVWAIMYHLMIKYVIEHPEGRGKLSFMASDGFSDGFEAIHSSELDEGKKYIYADEVELEICEG